MSKQPAKKKPSTKKAKVQKGLYTGKTLVVVEAPGKVKKIQGFLGPDYIVKASVGHIMDLPQKGLGVDLDNNYEPTYEVMPGKTDVVDEIKQIAKQVSTVILAGDEDREGEFICYSVAMQIKRPGLTIQRAKFNSITKSAVIKAIQNPTVLDKNLVRAQQGRRILDRLVGFKVSPLLWSSIRKGLSAGRVQSVGLRIIVDRQNEIDAFVPKDYWTIEAKFTLSNGETFTAQIPEKYEDYNLVTAALQKIQQGTFKIIDIEAKKASKAGPAPFTTSAMQIQASTTFNWSAKRTNSAAQKLYEAGKCTYIRSDSTTIDPTAVTVIRQEISTSAGAKYLPSVAPVYKNKANAQEAHEAIRPTDISITSLTGQVPPDEAKLYEMIYRRTMASQTTPAQFDRIVVKIENNGLIFIAKGQTLTFDGYLKYWIYGDTKEVTLPILKTGQVLSNASTTDIKHTTKPPPRYNTASIIKELEDTGVGRPSTYQSIIDTLLNRNYITLEGKAFVPTPIGKEVANILKDHIDRVVDVTFTAEMEEKLDQVAQGRLDWIASIDHFWKLFETDIAKANAALANKSAITNHKCLKCGAPLVRRISSGGPFYACTNIDPAKQKTKSKVVINNIPGKSFCGAIFQIGLDEKPIERQEEVYSEPCKTCGAPMVKKGFKGVTFWGCSNYNLTGCKTTCSMNGEWKLPTPTVIVAKCDKCSKGNMVIKNSKRGPFVACDNFPKCKNAKSLKDFNIDKDGQPLSS